MQWHGLYRLLWGGMKSSFPNLSDCSSSFQRSLPSFVFTSCSHFTQCPFTKLIIIMGIHRLHHSQQDYVLPTQTHPFSYFITESKCPQRSRHPAIHNLCLAASPLSLQRNAGRGRCCIGILFKFVFIYFHLVWKAKSWTERKKEITWRRILPSTRCLTFSKCLQ